MNKQEFDELRKTVIDITTKAIQEVYDDEFLSEVENGLFKIVNVLPKHKETIRTFKGIVGFNEFLKSNPSKNGAMAINALHDLSECTKNYLQPWFSPRLGRYATNS